MSGEMSEDVGKFWVLVFSGCVNAIRVAPFGGRTVQRVNATVLRVCRVILHREYERSGSDCNLKLCHPFLQASSILDDFP